MKLYIKSMESAHRISAVKRELSRLGVQYLLVKPGVAELQGIIQMKAQLELRIFLLKSGMELMDNARELLIVKIKKVITELVFVSNERPRNNFSLYLSEKLGYNYTYLANVFSGTTGTTIEHYFIEQRIERVKQLLLSDEHNLANIALKMHYSSIAHLANQFKKVTGLTTSMFRQKNRFIPG